MGSSHHLSCRSRTLLLGLVGALTPISAAGAADPALLSTETRRELESVTQRVLESVPLPGLAMGIVVGDHLAYTRGFGVVELGTRTPVTPDTLFQIGSISKSFTATLAAQLADQGILEFDDLVSDHFRFTPLPDDRITLGQLASHTSGLPGDAPTLRRKHGDYPVLAFTHFELYRSLSKAQLQFPPGSNWGYSNFGYALLGHVLEIVTGTPYEVLVTDQLFKPLGMESSTVTLWPELADRLATPHWLVDGRLERYSAPWDQEALAPAGGIASTVRDLSRYLIFQMSPENGTGAVAALRSEQWKINPRLSYGMGWFLETIPGVGAVVSVGGDVDGYVGEIVFAPEHRIGTILLTNTGDAPPLPHLGRWLLGSLLAKARPEAEREARYRLGLVYQSIGEWEQAVSLFSELTDAKNPHRTALYQLGRTGDLSGRYLKEAADALRRYLQFDPIPGVPRATARWRLGSVYERSGRHREAEHQYVLALEEDADHSRAREALDRLRSEPTGEEVIRSTIEQRGRAFSAAYVAADADRLAGFYTEDAELLPPGRDKIQGRNGIREFWARLDADRIIEHHLETTSLRSFDSVATEIGQWTERSLDFEGSEHVGTGRYLVVWQCGNDGVWRIMIDMWGPSNRGKER